MWEAVRRGLIRLHWDTEPPLTADLMAGWTQTVQRLMAIRRAVGPVPDDDPVALLATATMGAARVRELRPIVAPSLQGVDAALADIARVLGARPDDVDRQGETSTLNQVAYELVHWMRVQTADDRARAWLQAGETALDSAIHDPAARSTMSAGLAAWQEALAAVQPVHEAPIVRRSVALGHLMLLREAKAMVTYAQDGGMLPQPYADAVLDNIGELARSHLATLAQIDGWRLGSSRVDQAVMLRVGVAVRQLTTRPDIAEPATGRLAALLRSSVGEAVLVANLTQDASAKPVAAALNRLALEYLANPGILRLEAPPASTPIDAPVGRRPAPPREAPDAAAPAPPGGAIDQSRNGSRRRHDPDSVPRPRPGSRCRHQRCDQPARDPARDRSLALAAARRGGEAGGDRPRRLGHPDGVRPNPAGTQCRRHARADVRRAHGGGLPV